MDVWAQIANPRFSQQAWLKPLLRWTGRDALPPSTVAETVAAMDAGGVDLALISAWSAPTGWLIENGEVADQVAAAPDRLRGLAAVDLARPMEAAREVRRCAEQGFVGVRVVPWLWDLPPNDRRYYPVYAACVEAGLPFCTQIGHTGPL
ncbi:MAG: amidohydrolase family protein, partial [Pseudomonadota bacterium]